MKLEEEISELKTAGIALNDQLTALKSSKKALQLKLTRVEEGMHIALSPQTRSLCSLLETMNDAFMCMRSACALCA